MAIRSTAQVNSPYSRLGIGELMQGGFSVNRSMGGLTAAFTSSTSINNNNPASYAGLKLTTFEAGLFGVTKNLKTADQKISTGNVSIGWLVLAFPVSKFWGASFGLMPYSVVSYDITDTESDPDPARTISYLYTGSGGLTQFYLGNGFKVKNISFGVNLAYLFGTLTQTKIVSFPELPNSFSDRITKSLSMGDVFWNAGIQYEWNIKEDMSLTIGLTGSTENKMKTEQFTIFERGNIVDNTDFVVVDTLSDTTVSGQDVILPSAYTFGAILRKKDKWLVGINFETMQWSNFESFDNGFLLSDSWRLGIGGEIIPKSTDINSYWNLVQYRVGFVYGLSNLSFNGEQLADYGITFGVGLPIRRSFSKINISIELGQLGKSDSNLIQEEYLRGTLGLTLSERWFRKRRFD